MKDTSNPADTRSPENAQAQADGSAGNSMWGGRFSEGPGAIMKAINASIDIDRHLYREDIAGSKAHAAMLGTAGVLSAEDVSAIHSGLDQVAREIEAGDMVFDPALEDIHMHVEARLTDLIGDAGKRLHTGRSRNDQVATDFRLFVRAAMDDHIKALTAYIEALVTQADTHAETVMPGFTHLQTAQPVTLGHHLMAYAEMAWRDRDRFIAARTRMNESPLGAAALAGTGYAIDRFMTSDALGFDHPMRNSLDAVSARDFATDYLHAATTAAIHLSRFAEELVIWASAPFRFITLDDGFSTGSSIMPQKRNPDAAELVRAKPGRLLGALTGLMTVMKGLPLAYSKDMQEDKAPVLQAVEDFTLALAAMTGMVETLNPNKDALRAAAGDGYSTATDLADGLVRDLGVPFRSAHHITGAVVKRAEDLGVTLEHLPLSEYQAIEPKITAEMVAKLSLDQSVASRNSYGGTAPEQVRAAIANMRARLKA